MEGTRFEVGQKVRTKVNISGREVVREVLWTDGTFFLSYPFSNPQECPLAARCDVWEPLPTPPPFKPKDDVEIVGPDGDGTDHLIGDRALVLAPSNTKGFLRVWVDSRCDWFIFPPSSLKLIPSPDPLEWMPSNLDLRIMLEHISGFAPFSPNACMKCQDIDNFFSTLIEKRGAK